jgi:hypothetical protein
MMAECISCLRAFGKFLNSIHEIEYYLNRREFEPAEARLRRLTLSVEELLPCIEARTGEKIDNYQHLLAMALREKNYEDAVQNKMNLSSTEEDILEDIIRLCESEIKKTK